MDTFLPLERFEPAMTILALLRTILRNWEFENLEIRKLEKSEGDGER